MRCLLLFFVGVFLLSYGLVTLSDLPGALTLHWGETTLKTSLAVAVMGGILLILAATVILLILVFFLRLPGKWHKARIQKQKDLFLTQTTQALLALGNGDAQRAQIWTRQLGRNTTQSALVPFIAAQAAQLSGNPEEAQRHFQKMLESPESFLPGLHGLFIEAHRRGDREAAEEAVRRAVAHPTPPSWAQQALFEMQVKERRWMEALETLQKCFTSGLFRRSVFERRRAVLLVAAAQEILEAEMQDKDHAAAQACLMACEAHQLAPRLIPATVLAGKLLARQGKLKKAAGILEAGWIQEPHPEIAQAYAHLRTGDSALDRCARIKRLVNLRPHAEEGTVALAQAAIETHEWATARALLAPLCQSFPTQKRCLLMARIEEGEKQDIGRQKEWLARALHAPRDRAWICGTVAYDSWFPCSPTTGELDVCVWDWPAPLPPHTVDLSLQEFVLERLSEISSPTEGKSLSHTARPSLSPRKGALSTPRKPV